MSKQSLDLGGFIFEVLRVHGRLLSAGDSLVKPIGLTSARWQILTIYAQHMDGSTVAGCAKSLGLARQSVQRVTDDLERESYLISQSDPKDARARLFLPTSKGFAALEKAEKLRVSWTEALLKKCENSDFSKANQAIAALREALDRL